MAEIQLKQVRKVYPNGFVGVHGADLDISSGEFCVIVGPSGSGKSTLLRMVAGLEDITSGDLYIAGRRVNDVPPKDRDIAMVFQNYALYPHMNVYDNMAFGLRLRGLSEDEIDKRVREASEFLQLAHLLDRKPKTLSGGQRQRVAVGRSIVRKPKAFLFDEPLSNLDAKLRVEMRAELARLHRRLSATSLYVTHDQVEAMTLADRIVVMKDGHVQQVGPPLELYAQPANRFVAGFIGSPAMNFIDCTLEERGESLVVVNGDFLARLTPEHADAVRSAKNSDRRVVFGIRPEHIHDKLFLPDAPADQTISALVDVVEPMGAETYAYVRVGEALFTVRLRGDALPKVGTQIDLVLDMARAYLFDHETGTRIA
ncbi:MAG: sn-glycerol-3-phosphate ABC transporter ATP-binding protein UgpC [Candidatus Hydrogenedentota bacterium]|nr:MAG: sn-glycerol-3-phosphate ABC transporter ATP-binding protein UgpC [Candidatus Hydrogenedentota bacterium]